MADEPTKILIVDDDEDITLTISDYFRSQNLGLIPISTSDPRKVLPLLEEHRDIRLILSDFRMPGLNGLELLMMVKSQYPQALFVIMTGYSTQELKREGLKHGAIRYIEKPFDLGELADTIKEALQGPAAGFGGVIEAIQLPDIIQLIGMSRRTVTLEIIADQGKAAVYFEDGEIVHALCGEQRGEEAFYELFRWTGGRFSFTALPDNNPHTISQSWQGLLIEAARREDEAKAEAAPKGGNGGVPAGFIGNLEEAELIAAPAPSVKTPEPAMPPESTASPKPQPSPATNLENINRFLTEEAVITLPSEKASTESEAPTPPAQWIPTATWTVRDRALQDALNQALAGWLAHLPTGAETVAFSATRLEFLTHLLRRHFLFHFHHLARGLVNVTDSGFDFSRQPLAQALEQFLQALLNNWKMPREFYARFLEGAFHFEVSRALDPVRALIDYLLANSGGGADEVCALLQEMMEFDLIDGHFQALIPDLSRQGGRRLHPRQIEYLGRAILYRREEDEGCKAVGQAMANLLELLSGTEPAWTGLPGEVIVAMLEAHGAVQAADFIRSERRSAQNSLTIADYDAAIERYRRFTG